MLFNHMGCRDLEIVERYGMGLYLLIHALTCIHNYVGL